MLIHCESCGARFRIDTSGIKLAKFKIKCPKCQDAIVVENPPEVDVPVTIEDGGDDGAAAAAPAASASASPEASPAAAAEEESVGETAAPPPAAAAPEPPPAEAESTPAATETPAPPAEEAPAAPPAAEGAPPAGDAAPPPPAAAPATPPPVTSGPPPPPPPSAGDEGGSRLSRIRKRATTTGGGSGTDDLIETVRAELASKFHQLKDCNYFELLGVDPETQIDKVKTAYFALAKKYHPDRFTAHFSDEEMQKLREVASRLNMAFAELRDPERHEQYKLKILEPDRFEKQQAANRVMEAMMQYEKGKVLFNKNNFAEALECFEWAVELHPDEAEYHFMLSQAIMRNPESGRGVEAIEECLKRAVELDENSTKYHMALGRYWKQRDEIKRAMLCFKKVRDIDANNHEAKREIRLYLQRKQREAEENTATGKIKKLFKAGGGSKR